MRYQIQVMTAGPAARRRGEEAIEAGLIDEADICGAFIQGVADETQLVEMESRGLALTILSEVSPPPAPPTIIRRSTGFGNKAGFQTAPTARIRMVPRAPDGYYSLTLKGLLTPAVRARLEAAGAAFLERIAGREWSIRLTADPRAVARDGATETLTPVGGSAAPRARSASAGTSDSTADGTSAILHEALLQPDANREAIEARLRELGVEPIESRARIIRFLGAPQQAAAAALVPGIASIAPAGLPRLLHDMARPLVGITGGVNARPAGLDGEGELVGVADTGLDSDHPDFSGRIAEVIALGRPGNGSDPHGHGTHVAGTILGDGTASNGDLAGMAPRARLFFQSLMDASGGLGGLPDDVGDLFQPAYDAGVRVHNNSWGIFLHARYAGPSFDVDRFVHEHPDFLPVIAAGNDGSCLPGHNAGGKGLVDLPSMSVPATAKNALVVGASRSPRKSLGFAEMRYGELWPDDFNAAPIADALVSGDENCLAAFSARGPTDDMRIKPDVVAPGTDIVSARSADAPDRHFWGAYPGNDHYALMGGTSMACPVVAGLAALVRQYYRRDRNHAASAALLRATIVNGADPLTGADAVAAPCGNPNYHQGFGRVNLARTLPVDPAAGAGLAFVDTISEPDLELAASGDAREFTVEVLTKGTLRFCLAWTDPPARSLQNALLIVVESPLGEVWLSNPDITRQFRFATPHPAGPPGRFFDRDPHNNIHVLRLEDADPGTYIVTVATFDLLTPQGFALVLTGPVGALKHVSE